MSQLFAPVCSITSTRRRRFLWAAWWTAPPARDPFRKPDAHSGGARTRAEALAQAERAAGARLLVIEPLWATAWARVLRGQAPWSKARAAPGDTQPASRPGADDSASVWAILGVTRSASAVELKAAYHRRARETHPDRGGNAADFRKIQRAYEEATRRSARPRRSKASNHSN